MFVLLYSIGSFDYRTDKFDPTQLVLIIKTEMGRGRYSQKGLDLITLGP